MKKQLLTIILSAASLLGFAQTAVNFNCNDCAATSHDLFTELDAGKVIVLVWVMPCGACVSASLTTYNVCESYQSSNPNTVYMYLCDDYGNTACSSVNSWANTNGLTNAVRFSNSSISMADYSSTGMPKIVVVGGTNHTVYYNVNNSVNATNLQNAINSALNATGINEPSSAISSLNISPNPVANNAEMKFNLAVSTQMDVELYNLQGQKLENIFSGKLSSGENRLNMNLAGYAEGMYLVKFSDGDKNQFVNVVVSR